MQFVSARVQKLKPETLSRLATILAWLAFDLLRLRRRLVLNNLVIAFGETLTPDERVKLARQSYYHFALTVLEVLGTQGSEIAQNCEINGAEHLQQALAQGHGALILCGHLGNWECLAGALHRNFTQVHVVVKKVGGDGMNRFVDERRSKIGMQSIPRNTGMAAIRAIIKRLKDNQIVGFVMDQSRPGEPRLPFFGKPAKTNTGLATIWRRTEAPILPAFIRRVGVNRHVVTILPPLSTSFKSDSEEELLAATAHFNEKMESMIRQAPEQYFWLHNRWK